MRDGGIRRVVSSRSLAAVLVAVACLQLSGCGLLIGHAIRETQRKTQEESQVTASLARYRQLVAGADVERIVDMFTSGGELAQDGGPVLKGQAEIRAHLQASSAGRTVQEVALTPTSTKTDGGTALQEGSFRQVLRAADGSTVASSGTFKASWAHQPDGRWLLSSWRTTAQP